MTDIELLRAENYSRIPWKNGRGEMIVIDSGGGDSWAGSADREAVAWHFGRTAILEEGPFSDYTGYERLQVVVAGAGLVLVAPDHEIDLRKPLRPARYDGGTPIRTRLEQGPVEVVNLIALRARFDIDLRAGEAGSVLACTPGLHVAYAPSRDLRLRIDQREHPLEKGQAIRIRTDSAIQIAVSDGELLIGSIRDRR